MNKFKSGLLTTLIFFWVCQAGSAIWLINWFGKKFPTNFIDDLMITKIGNQNLVAYIILGSSILIGIFHLIYGFLYQKDRSLAIMVAATNLFIVTGWFHWKIEIYMGTALIPWIFIYLILGSAVLHAIGILYDYKEIE